MQYLECLSAALSDMAATYQPAQRMSTVLRAVMVELRGGPDPANSTSFNLYKPKSAVVPARRGSTIDEETSGQWGASAKKRQTSRPRASSRKQRTSSMSTSMSISLDNGNISNKNQRGLSIKPVPPRFDDPAENSFIMVTPRSDLGGWGSDMPELSHTLSTPSTTLSISQPDSNSTGAWMGFESSSSATTSRVPDDKISQLANAHFPELSAFDDTHDRVGGDLVGMTNLDFLSLDVGEEGGWASLNGKEWSGGLENIAGDLDGFPVDGGFGLGLEGKF